LVRRAGRARADGGVSARGYFTVSVARMPACSWPGSEQYNV
jgi:hypothetical protein